MTVAPPLQQQKNQGFRVRVASARQHASSNTTLGAKNRPPSEDYFIDKNLARTVNDRHNAAAAVDKGQFQTEMGAHNDSHREMRPL